jgi:hypothetical protein
LSEMCTPAPGSGAWLGLGLGWEAWQTAPGHQRLNWWLLSSPPLRRRRVMPVEATTPLPSPPSPSPARLIPCSPCLPVPALRCAALPPRRPRVWDPEGPQPRADGGAAAHHAQAAAGGARGHQEDCVHQLHGAVQVDEPQPRARAGACVG